MVPYVLCLSKERQNLLARGVRLGKHGGSRLCENLVPGVIDHNLRHVRVPDSGFRSLHVLGSDVQAVDGMSQPVLVRAKIRTLFVHDFQRRIQCSPRSRTPRAAAVIVPM